MKTTIVLNKVKDVRELYDKRSSIYSDRPDNYIVSSLASHGMRLIFMVCMPTNLISRNYSSLICYSDTVYNGVQFERFSIVSSMWRKHGIMSCTSDWKLTDYSTICWMHLKALSCTCNDLATRSPPYLYMAAERRCMMMRTSWRFSRYYAIPCLRGRS